MKECTAAALGAAYGSFGNSPIDVWGEDFHREAGLFLELQRAFPPGTSRPLAMDKAMDALLCLIEAKARLETARLLRRAREAEASNVIQTQGKMG